MSAFLPVQALLQMNYSLLITDAADRVELTGQDVPGALARSAETLTFALLAAHEFNKDTLGVRYRVETNRVTAALAGIARDACPALVAELQEAVTVELARRKDAT